MGLSPQVVKRLAFIRFLYNQGLEQAARPQPLASTALLSFHDAVEMFLLLAAEHLDVNLSNGVNFDGYFGEIRRDAGIELPARPAMRRMNRSRVNFKHHGSIPSATDLEQCRADVATFFTDATQMVFGVDFTSVEMIDLVTQQLALAKLREAEACAAQGEYVEALALLSEAFDGLLDDYSDRKRSASGSSPYRWWPPENSFAFPSIGRIYGRGHDDQMVARTSDLAKQTEQIDLALKEMQRAMRVLAMGIDYRRYARFYLLVPYIACFMDGRREVRAIPGLQAGDDEYQFCKQFVIESALQLAELDFDLDVLALYREHARREREAQQAQIPAAE